MAPSSSINHPENHNLTERTTRLKHIPIHNTEKDTMVKRIEDAREFNFDGTHRHAFYEILLFTETPEGALHNIDFEEGLIRTDRLYILNPGQVYSMALTSHKGFLITIRSEYLQSSGLLFENRLGSMVPSILNFGNKDMGNIRVFVKVLYEEHTVAKRPQIIAAHINTLLSYLSLFIRDYHTENGISNRMRSLLELIERHYTSEHDVAYYAAKLSLGKKRLNVLSVEAFGVTVKQLLGNRLLLQAKRMISTSHSTFKEISSDLGFKDGSYFSRFFRKQSGMTPEEFRRCQKKQS